MIVKDGLGHGVDQLVHVTRKHSQFWETWRMASNNIAEVLPGTKCAAVLTNASKIYFETCSGDKRRFPWVVGDGQSNRQPHRQTDGQPDHEPHRQPNHEPHRQGALECDGGSKLGTHCVCVQPQLCVGSTCAHSIGDSAQAVSGWNPDHCADCRCSSGNHRP